MKIEVYVRKVDTREKLLPHIFYVAVNMQKSEDQLRRATRDLRTRLAKFIESNVGSLENLLWTVPHLSFKH